MQREKKNEALYARESKAAKEEDKIEGKKK